MKVLASSVSDSCNGVSSFILNTRVLLFFICFLHFTFFPRISIVMRGDKNMVKVWESDLVLAFSISAKGLPDGTAIWRRRNLIEEASPEILPNFMHTRVQF